MDMYKNILVKSINYM